MAAQGTAGPAEAVLDHIEDGADLIVPLANGEPVSVLDAVEANASRWPGVRVHQMHALRDRPYLHGSMREHLLHMSYVLSPVTGPAFHEGGCELVPNNLPSTSPGGSPMERRFRRESARSPTRCSPGLVSTATSVSTRSCCRTRSWTSSKAES